MKWVSTIVLVSGGLAPQPDGYGKFIFESFGLKTCVFFKTFLTFQGDQVPSWQGSDRIICEGYILK